MAQRASDVRRDIEHTRTALTTKIETLDERVRGKVEDVKNSVDLSYHVQHRPWSMLAASLVVGFLLERMLSGDSAVTRVERRRPTFIPIPIYPDGRAEHGTSPAEAASTAQGSPATGDKTQQTDAQPKTDSQPRQQGRTPVEQEQEKDSGMLGDVLGQFEGELQTIKGMALGAVTSVIHDLIKQATPAASSFVKQTFNTASAKLTGHGIPEAQPDPPSREQDPQTTEFVASAYAGTRPPSLREEHS